MVGGREQHEGCGLEFPISPRNQYTMLSLWMSLHTRASKGRVIAEERGFHNYE
jgi:hypothetical protein